MIKQIEITEQDIRAIEILIDNVTTYNDSLVVQGAANYLKSFIKEIKKAK